MKLSVVIVNYKTPELTDKLLQSLLNEKLNLEIVLVDNGSNDGIDKIVQKKYPTIKYIKSKTNLGFSKGYNCAINQCKAEYILMLNSDIKVRKGSLKLLLRYIRKYPNSVLTNKLILPNNIVQKSAFHLPNIFGAFKEYILGIQDVYFSYLPNQQIPTQVDGAVMASFLIPRKIWNKVGALDEGTQLYFEDVEYCRRLKRHRVPIYYLPDVVFDHHHGASSKKLPNNDAIDKLKTASIRYHGPLSYWIITLLLFMGQKIRKK